MFTVYEKGVWKNDERAHARCLKAVEVYSVRDDKNGYPHFLICENGEWKYRSAKYYTNKPVRYAWHDKNNYPKEMEEIIVRDSNGKEYFNHYWNGHAYYNYDECDDYSYDEYLSNVNIVEWRYKE